LTASIDYSLRPRLESPNFEPSHSPASLHFRSRYPLRNLCITPAFHIQHHFKLTSSTILTGFALHQSQRHNSSIPRCSVPTKASESRQLLDSYLSLPYLSSQARALQVQLPANDGHTARPQRILYPKPQPQSLSFEYITDLEPPAPPSARCCRSNFSSLGSYRPQDHTHSPGILSSIIIIKTQP
jgi:hypothetical protein